MRPLRRQKLSLTLEGRAETAAPIVTAAAAVRMRIGEWIQLLGFCAVTPGSFKWEYHLKEVE